MEKEIFKDKTPSLGNIDKLHLKSKQVDDILRAATDGDGMPVAHRWTMAEIEQGQDGRAQELKDEADKELAFMPAPSRYAAKAMELNRENAKFILKLRAPGVGPYVRELYDTLRSLNPVHYIPEKLTALWSGKEPVLGNKVDRKQTAEELAVYAAFMGLGKALDVGMGELKGYLFTDGITPTPVPPAGDAPDVKPTSLPNAEPAVGGGETEAPGAVANADGKTKNISGQATSTPETGTGEYGDVGGHHIHAKAAFKGDVNYDPNKGFSISQDYMTSRDWNHNAMSAKQRELFKELAKSGKPNTLAEQSRIAEEALIAGGATRAEAQQLIQQSLANLKQQGVKYPSRIPWSQ